MSISHCSWLNNMMPCTAVCNVYCMYAYRVYVLYLHTRIFQACEFILMKNIRARTAHAMLLRWPNFLIWWWTVAWLLASIVNDWRYRHRLPLARTESTIQTHTHRSHLPTILIMLNRNFNEPLRNAMHLFSSLCASSPPSPLLPALNCSDRLFLLLPFC